MLERVDDRIDELDRVVLVVVEVLVAVRESVACATAYCWTTAFQQVSGTRCASGSLTATMSVTRSVTTVLVKLSPSQSWMETFDAVDVTVREFVVAAKTDEDAEVVDAGVGNAVLVLLALGVREPTNVDDADAG